MTEPANARRASGGRRPSRYLNVVLSGLVLAGAIVVPMSAAPIEAPTPLQSGDAASARVGPFTFAIGPYALRLLPEERLAYYGASIVPSCGLTDPSGVAMYRASDGEIYNHPVAQTRCALNMQRNYRLTGDQAYLDTSIANAQRLLDRAVTHQGALFFPYPFPWSNPGRGFMTPPWYSAMAQGQALSVFVRLYEWTGDAAWLQWADRTFASFRVARSAGTPWVVGVEGGLLVLDEYPSTPLDRVFNGHNFGMYGLYDYWRVTGDEEARLLALGALHTAYTLGSARIRVPGGISYYCSSDKCLAAEVKNPAYHRTHISQLRELFWMTGHWHFGSLAEAFMADTPFASAGHASLAAGAHDGYSFDSSGNGMRVATLTLASVTALSYSERNVPGGGRKPGNGIWLRIAEGALNGLWVRESGRAWPIGFVDQIDFLHARPIRLAAGTYTGRSHDSSGMETGSAQASSHGGTWTYTQVARINGQPSVLVASGPLVGWWLALDARMTRDSTLFTDIDASAFRNEIIWLHGQGITHGCTTWAFCPRAGVTREQMASFLVRALKLPATTRDFFTDDETSQHESAINRLAASGITGGCGSGRFCPRAGVTREQMAAFLERALRVPPGVTSAAARAADTDGDDDAPTPEPTSTPSSTPTSTPTPTPNATPPEASPSPIGGSESPTPSLTPTPSPSPPMEPSATPSAIADP